MRAGGPRRRTGDGDSDGMRIVESRASHSMSRHRRLPDYRELAKAVVAWLGATLAVAAALMSANAAAAAAHKTVCTITVNSADEKESLRRLLPPDQYQFVELVERGRPDWLASACRQNIRCDVLVISGHYDGGNEFFSDQVEAREYLPVAELERASCSESDRGIFAELKEVYLFGCNTLDAVVDAQHVGRDRAQPAARGTLARGRGARRPRRSRRAMATAAATACARSSPTCRRSTASRRSRRSGRWPDRSSPATCSSGGTQEFGTGRQSRAPARRTSARTRLP